MAYFDSGHGHALDSAPQDDYLSDNQNKLDEMQVTRLLLAFRAVFSFPASPTFESKWSILLSSLCLRKVHKCPWWFEGLDHSASLGFGSSHAFEVSAT